MFDATASPDEDRHNPFVLECVRDVTGGLEHLGRIAQEGDVRLSLHQHNPSNTLHSRFRKHTKALCRLPEGIAIGQLDHWETIHAGHKAKARRGHESRQRGQVRRHKDLAVLLFGQIEQRTHQHPSIVRMLRCLRLLNCVNHVALGACHQAFRLGPQEVQQDQPTHAASALVKNRACL